MLSAKNVKRFQGCEYFWKALDSKSSVLKKNEPLLRMKAAVMSCFMPAAWHLITSYRLLCVKRSQMPPDTWLIQPLRSGVGPTGPPHAAEQQQRFSLISSAHSVPQKSGVKQGRGSWGIIKDRQESGSAWRGHGVSVTTEHEFRVSVLF